MIFTEPLKNNPHFSRDLAAQREYVAAMEHNTSFAAYGDVWHYCLKAEDLHEDLRKMAGAAPFYVLSIRIGPEVQPRGVVVLPCQQASDWLNVAMKAQVR